MELRFWGNNVPVDVRIEGGSLLVDLKGDALDCSVFAGVFPEDKIRLVRAFRKCGAVVGMSGDGVNDAPALRQAEAGVAVSSATDVAKAAAALVLTRPGLGDVVPAIETRRRVFRRIITPYRVELAGPEGTADVRREQLLATEGTDEACTFVRQGGVPIS